jgi:hypothetical protein
MNLSLRNSKTRYIVRSLSKIARKEWELFVVSRVVHGIDEDIEFVCQQLVRRPDGSRALTDLFFPQFNLHLEVDEPFHSKQVNADEKRTQDIVGVTGHCIERISVLNAQEEPKSLDVLRGEVDDFVERLRSKRLAHISSGTFQPWDWENRYSARSVLDRGYMDVNDNIMFRTQVEAMKCFGFEGRGWQKGAWTIPDGSEDWLWFPRLYEHFIWKNELTPDGQRIFQRALSEEGVLSISKQMQDAGKNPDRNVIVLAKARDPLGLNLLRYVGTFRVNFSESTRDCMQFDLVRTREPTRLGPETG